MDDQKNPHDAQLAATIAKQLIARAKAYSEILTPRIAIWKIVKDLEDMAERGTMLVEDNERAVVIRDVHGRACKLTLDGKALVTQADAAAEIVEWCANGEIALLPKLPDGSDDEAAATAVRKAWRIEDAANG